MLEPYVSRFFVTIVDNVAAMWLPKFKARHSPKSNPGGFTQ